MAEEETITEEQIAKNYAAMLDSVDFLNNQSKPDYMSDDMWNDMRASNVNHLELMVAKDYWTDEDMTAVNKAIADNK
tara:strand:- start:58 stop:288 length:231 start_codon:yes stop_codon:yes gene_type:complete